MSKKSVFPETTDTEKLAFLGNLNKLFPDAAVLTGCYETHSANPASNFTSLPPTVLSLYQPKYKKLNPDQLQCKCKNVFEKEFVITPEESKFLFDSTILQSHSLFWFEHRRGRLTASKFGAICRTSVGKPSKSLLSEILHRKLVPKTKAIKWGMEHERAAIAAYVTYSSVKHPSIKVHPCGLLVSPLAPHLGATPDGIITCECCDIGLLEIKCPYSVREKSPTTASYIEKTQTGFRLSRKHDYYYQIQGQIAVFDYAYCDFVCWTQKGVFVERIFYDEKLVSNIIPKLNLFFIEAVLPSVLCGTYKELPSSDDETEIHCVCRQKESGRMIQCDSIHCEIGWYHYDCLKLPEDFQPDDEWFCPDCEKKQKHI